MDDALDAPPRVFWKSPEDVLILLLMDDALDDGKCRSKKPAKMVLILLLMDDALDGQQPKLQGHHPTRLNPSFNG